MNQHEPPHRALRFLRWFCRRDYLEEIEGDLTEIYQRDAPVSMRKASWHFRFAVIRYFRPEFIRSFKGQYTQNHSAMLQHHLKLSFRNFSRNRSTFIINLVGLASALASVLLIYLWVHDELSMDQFQSPNLYQVMEQRVQQDELVLFKTTSGPTAETLAQQFPEVEHAVTTTGTPVTTGDEEVLLTPGDQTDKDVMASGVYSSSEFFQVFSFPLLQGDPERVLKDQRSMVVSESLARKLFGNVTAAMGETVTVDKDKRFTITGIYEDMPTTSSLQFDYILPIALFAENHSWMTTWFSTAPATYLLLKEGTNVDQFNAKIHDVVRDITDGEVIHRSMFVQAFRDIYLHGDYDNGIQSGGRIEYVRLFIIIAGFILLIASINFMNLSTARASTRMKEIGVKKSIGAQRKQIIVQFFTESTVVTLLAFLLAGLIIVLLLPAFNQMTGKTLVPDDPGMWLIALGIALFTGVLAGTYPAIYLSSFRPAAVLKGIVTRSINELWIRKGLVVIQFSLSVILIVSVLIVYEQIDYILNKDLGYDRAQVILFPSRTDDVIKKEAFIEYVRQLPGVTRAAGLGHVMIGHRSGTYGVEWPGKNPDNKTEFENITVDYGAIDLLGLEMAQGRAFSPDAAADSTGIIFNQTAIDFMGIEDPVGQVIRLWGEEMHIIGVVRDFNLESLREKIKPVFLRLSPSSSNNILAKIAPGREQEALGALQKLSDEFYPGLPVDYHFLDQEYRQQYVAETRVATLSRYFAGLAIIISCLGLFGLANFSAERRLKEIGIRKILGSGVTNIVLLLTGDFTRLVVLAIVIAIPISYLLAHHWLQNFAFSIDLSWWYFIAAGSIALLIAWVSVSFQTFRAALVNPVHCIKNE